MSNNVNNLLVRAKSLPSQSGVYKFYDADGRLLYIGKAKNLKNRVSSYFQKTNQLSPIKVDLVNKISAIDYIVVSNEIEALLLETTLIKKYKPPYNIDLKDDKSWYFIALSKENFPKIFLIRYHDIFKKQSFAFKIIAGPFFSGQDARRLMVLLKHVFPFYETGGAMVEISNKKGTPYHLGRYIKQPSLDDKSWQENIKQLVKLLNGHIKSLQTLLTQQINDAADKLNYERAQLLKNRLLALNKINLQQNIVVSKNINEDYVALTKVEQLGVAGILQVRNGHVINKQTILLNGDDDDQWEQVFNLLYPPNSVHIKNIYTNQPRLLTEVSTKPIKTKRQKSLIKIAEENAAQVLAKHLKIKNDQALKRINALTELKSYLQLKTLPKRIECFDISNFQGKQMVASMTVAIDGAPNNKHYRRFKIKTIKGIDDPRAMAETISRRLGHKNWPLPDLFIVDGGVTQVRAAAQVLQTNNINIPLRGIAKQFELLIDTDNQALKLEKRNPGLQLIQALRDEAHRFAITYHRLLRKKQLLGK